jgi:stage II sporulation protein D
MGRLKILVLFILSVISTLVSGQVKIRLFAGQMPHSVVFSVAEGRYEIVASNGVNLSLSAGESLLISRFDRLLSVKTRNSKGFITDSVVLSGKTGNDSFSLRINGNSPVRQFYSGDLRCFPDHETIVMINICDIEKYIAGVVMSEGGNGKNIEYYKTQAVIARTYMYRCIDRHMSDGYDVCDNTHCQAFNGITSDAVHNMAALETKGLVIIDHNSSVISAVFHSNCGGETSSSDDVWSTGAPYLKKVSDPYCTSSKNAVWQKSIGLNTWLEYVKRSGYAGKTDDPSVFSFSQQSRLADYTTGTFVIPLKKIRNELNLRSTFFSVIPEGDSIVLIGRGYGHGVGLCQEGAMVMAAKGFNYIQIIDFYYSEVMISDVKNALNLPRSIIPRHPYGGF